MAGSGRNTTRGCVEIGVVRIRGMKFWRDALSKENVCLDSGVLWARRTDPDCTEGLPKAMPLIFTSQYLHRLVKRW
jgi:hypothetical protein